MTTTLLASYDPETLPACLSNRVSFCSLSHSSCFSHTSLFGILQTHLAFYLCQGLYSFFVLSMICFTHSSWLTSGHSLLSSNVTIPSKISTSPHQHLPSPCPAWTFFRVLFSLSSTLLSGFQLCAWQNFSLCLIQLLYSFSNFS